MANLRPNGRRLTLIVFAALFLLLGYTLFAGGSEAKDVSYSQFMTEVEAGRFKNVEVDEGKRSLVGTAEDGKRQAAKYVGEDNIAEDLRKKGVDVKVVESGPGALGIVLQLLPLLFLLLIIFLAVRWMARSGGPAGAAALFGSSKAKRVDPKDITTRFSDVLGADEAVENARELVDFLRDPQKYLRMGARVPKGSLFVGPPGTGKTLLARAVAGEAGVPFFYTSGSEFVEMFVGVGAARVRSLMEEGKKNQPCIIFIDEIDAVGRQRGSGVGNTHDEREQTLNQLLVELDGFESQPGVLMIAATNRPDVLDPALLRRFGRQIVLPNPDLIGRRAILAHYVKRVVLAAGVNLDAVAAVTTGFSGDNLEKLVNEATLLAARRNHDAVEQSDLEEAFEKVVLGAPRKLVISAKEKRKTAVHEAGHTLIALEAQDGLEFHKVSIVPRGRALGVTWSLPTEDLVNRSESELLAAVEVLLGGRAAEIVVYSEGSTGASDDLQRSTEILRDMMQRCGMSKLGPVAFDTQASPVFLGRDLLDRRATSETTAREIEMEIVAKVKTIDERVQKKLAERRKALDALTEALLREETLSRERVLEIVAANSE